MKRKHTQDRDRLHVRLIVIELEDWYLVVSRQKWRSSSETVHYCIVACCSAVLWCYTVLCCGHSFSAAEAQTFNI